MAELHDQLGEVSLVRLDARLRQRLVQPDLVGAMDLTLTTSAGRLRRGPGPRRCRLASLASRAQCTTPPCAVTLVSSCSR